MKGRLRASLFPLFTGKHGVISSNTKLFLLRDRKRAFGHSFSSHQLYQNVSGRFYTNVIRNNSGLLVDRCEDDPFNSILSYSTTNYVRTLATLSGIENLKQLFSSSSGEEDFSELGPPVGRGVGTSCGHVCLDEDNGFSELCSPGGPRRRGVAATGKLMTEKPKTFKKSGNTRGASGESSSAALQLKTENKNNVPRPKNASRNYSQLRTLSSVTIANVPSVVNFQNLKAAMSEFGRILNASIREVPNGLDCCDVEFESVESSNKAVSVGGITVMNFNLPIYPLAVQKMVMIRIKNISSETAESSIHSVCISCGCLEGLVRAKEEAVDAFFRVDQNSDTQNILKRLNHTIMDGSKWSAHIEPGVESTSAEMTNNGDPNCQFSLQITSHIDELKEQITRKRLLVRDLHCLLHSLVHLEAHPTVINDLPGLD